jgi:dGTPase
LNNGEESERYRFGLHISAEAEAIVAVLKAAAFVLVFKDPRVTTLEAKGSHILKTLFDVLRKNMGLLPLDFQELIKFGNFGSPERLVADFIGGMTDRYAYVYYSRLFQPGSGSFYEDV